MPHSPFVNHLGAGATSSAHPPRRRHRLLLGGVVAFTLGLSGLVSAPAHAADPTTTPRSFDFQLSGKPVMAGYTEVNEKTSYTEARGYGFLDVSGLDGRDRGVGFTPAPNALQRDFLLPAAKHVFVVDVPDGEYQVTTYSGDWIASSKTTISLEGVSYGGANAASGAVTEKVMSPVVVADGQLTLVVTGDSTRLNGMDIRPILLAPAALRLDGVVRGDGVASVTLGWEAAENAAAYRVYRASAAEPTPVLVAEVPGTTATDSSALLSQTYAYTVTSVAADGFESVASAPLDVSTYDPAVPVPAVPTGLVLGEVTKTTVSFTWDASPGADSYAVFRASAADGTAVHVGTSATPEFTDTGLLTTVPYFYEVAAVSTGGESARSERLRSSSDTVLVRQMEDLDRSPVAVQTDDGVYVGWRMLGLDPDRIAFVVYRDGTKITPTPLTTSTNLVDPDGTADSVYAVYPVVDGVLSEPTADFGVWSQPFLDIPLDKPADGVTPSGAPFSYYAGDSSVGDLDGDGEYEIVLMWSPNNSQDNSKSGYTGEVFIDAYRLDGTRLWRISLGKNIRAGAHYTQMMVYDLDSDGRADVVLKTADGTVDGVGAVIGDASADHRNSGGYVLAGPEFLTVFDGQTGAAVDTIDYTPPRGNVGSWGDTYGNRVDRFLGAVAYLDGEHPSVVMSRGYYTRAVLAAYDYDGEHLTQRWVFDSNVEGSQYQGQGNHNLSVADVDGDQKDEIVFGSMTIDDNGKALYNTTLGHGDAMHLSDLIPSRPGLEVFAVHEEAPGRLGIAATMRDAATGEVIWSMPGTKDTGRGASDDIDPRHEGAESWAVTVDGEWNSPLGQMKAADGTLITNSIPAANFLTWWDGDLLREIADHDFDTTSRVGVPTVAKWDWENGVAVPLEKFEGTRTNNDTKGNPTLQADLFGDWREELVYRTDDSTTLRVFTTTDVTEHRLRTLMHDPVYRLGVAWQNVAYNQPPHPGFFLGEGMATPPAPSISYVGNPGDGLSTEPVGDPTAAAEAALTADLEGGITIPAGDWARGDVVPVTVVGADQAGAWASVWLWSTPTPLGGWQQVAEGNQLTATIPDDAALGDHRLVVQDGLGDVVGWATLVVAEETDPTGPTGPPTPTEPTTDPGAGPTDAGSPGPGEPTSVPGDGSSGPGGNQTGAAGSAPSGTADRLSESGADVWVWGGLAFLLLLAGCGVLIWRRGHATASRVD